jgi:hypothetical protein
MWASTQEQMTDETLFYQDIAKLDADLNDDQRAQLDILFHQYGAAEHYREMVEPSAPNPDEEQRDQDAAMRAFAIYQSVPESDWDLVYDILGPLKPRFDKAMEKVMRRFESLGIV